MIIENEEQDLIHKKDSTNKIYKAAVKKYSADDTSIYAYDASGLIKHYLQDTKKVIAIQGSVVNSFMTDSTKITFIANSILWENTGLLYITIDKDGVTYDGDRYNFLAIVDAVKIRIVGQSKAVNDVYLTGLKMIANYE